MKLIIADTEQLKEHVSINAAFDFAAIKPQIGPAQKLITRYVGEALMAELLASVTSQEEATPLENELIDLVRFPVANLALLAYAEMKNVQISEMGVSRAMSNGMADAFEWQHEGLRQALARAAYDGIEELLRYLERHLDEVPAYNESEVYQADKNLLIRSAAQFSRYYFIDNSRLVFQSLLPSLRATQQRFLWPILGTDRLYPLIDADLSGSLTTNQLEQLRLSQQALACSTVARALRERVIQIGPNGVTVSGVNSISYQRPADEKSLQKNIDFFTAEAEAALADLSRLLSPVPTILTTATSRVQGDAIVSF